MTANPFRDDQHLKEIATAAAELADSTTELYRLCNNASESLDLLATLVEIKTFFGDLANAGHVSPTLED